VQDLQRAITCVNTTFKCSTQMQQITKQIAPHPCNQQPRAAETDTGMMMMSYTCSCRNKNEPNAIYPLGTSLKY
jgi:hypothetical protein